MTVLICAVSWWKNKDPFSPVKIYLVYSIFFYSGIYFSEVRVETIACYFFLLISIFISLFVEPECNDFRTHTLGINSLTLYRSVWILSIPGVFVKLLFIYEAGGIVDYINNLAFRVQEWSGRGHLVMWFYMLPTLNLVYFCALITDSKRNFRRIVFYVAHFIVFFSVGLITGSRSFIALTLLGMIFTYSYLVRRVKIKYIISLAFLLIALAGVIGGVRNQFGNITGSTSINDIDIISKFENSQIHYGTIPLEILFASPERPLLYGSTYLSLMTNFIPRNIFPDKPDTGGIAFTKIYTDDQWGGLSNLATGAITEASINFGIPTGIVVGIVTNLIFFLFGCFVYGRLSHSKIAQRQPVISMVIYFYFILTAARYSFSEFTDIFQTFIFFMVLPCLLVKICSTTVKLK